MLRRFSGFGLALFVASACGDMPDVQLEQAPSDTTAALGGYVDNGHPAVGLVWTSTTVCTGTLVGRRTVLTAAHCIGASGESVVFQAEDPIAYWYESPGIAYPHPDFGGCPPWGCDWDDDIAVVKLQYDFYYLSGIPPTRLYQATPRSNWPITLVGYGDLEWDSSGGWGVKRWGSNTIDEVNSKKIQYDTSNNQVEHGHGDSGGPVYKDYYSSDCQIGVFSGKQNRISGSDFTACRVDRKYSWIQNTANDPSVWPCWRTSCNDGICHSQESCSTCPQDCGSCAPPPYCGDGSCNGTEMCSSCPSDCGACAGSCCSSPDCECFGDSECSEGWGGECFHGECMCFE